MRRMASTSGRKNRTPGLGSEKIRDLQRTTQGLQPCMLYAPFFGLFVCFIIAALT